MVKIASLETIADQMGWRDIPTEIITREGHAVHLDIDVWHLPFTNGRSLKIFIGKVSNLFLSWIIKAYLIDKIVKVSTHSAHVSFNEIYRYVIKNGGLENIVEPAMFHDAIIFRMEELINEMRAKHKLWSLYRVIQWYIWCAEKYPELGFSQSYAMELESMQIPGNPKGEAVRSEDPDNGPLHRSLELPLLIKALKNDKSQELEHLQQRAAIALSIAFGRNPANLVFLKEIDVIDITEGQAEPCYMVKMPRIKKRQLNPRDDFIEEYMSGALALHLVALIQRNKQIETDIRTAGTLHRFPKPIFIRSTINKAALEARQWDSVFNMFASEITDLVQNFCARHKIISPVTGQVLNITMRRLRYTLATNLVAEGISRRELARILDHSDTQNVAVYFDMASRIVEHLDKATAKFFAEYVSFFTGRVIDRDVDATNGTRNDKHLIYVDESAPTVAVSVGVCGETALCHLDPPYSCYLCPKFQPYRHADHEYVLDRLLANRVERIKKFDKARIGVQLDDVIVAVSNVVKICQPNLENE